MAKSQFVKITGTKDIRQALTDLGIEADDQLEKITLETAKLIRKEVVKRVPVRTGNLKRNISRRTLSKKNGEIVVGIGPQPGKQVPTFYGLFIEFGAAAHDIPRTGPDGKPLPPLHHPGIPARPFMRPAFDENIDRSIAEAARIVKEKLKL